MEGKLEEDVRWERMLILKMAEQEQISELECIEDRQTDASEDRGSEAGPLSV